MNNDMTNREHAFKSAMNEAKRLHIESIQETIDALYEQYLPHVEDDSGNNAGYLAQSIVSNILAGEITPIDGARFSVKDRSNTSHLIYFNRPAILKALVSAMGESIRNARIDELENEVSQLKEDIRRWGR